MGMTVPEDQPAEQVIAGYRAATADSDVHIRAAGDLDVRTARSVNEEPRTLRWVPHDQRNHPARRTRRHPSQTHRRCHRPLIVWRLPVPQPLVSRNGPPEAHPAFGKIAKA
jgi:hypothetical protein